MRAVGYHRTLLFGGIVSLSAAIVAPALACASGARGSGDGERSVVRQPEQAERVPADSQGAGSATTTASDRDDGREIVLALSGLLEVRLTAVPGTGYRWTVNGSAPEVLRLDEEHLDLGGATAPGAAATAVLRWTAVRVGEGVLRLAYSRAWEKDTPPKKTFALRVKVK